MKRTFAGAIDWPGWARSGKDDDSALDALVASAPRYARVVARTQLGFKAPADPAELTVIERLKGDATTDFGVPGAVPAADDRPLKEVDLRRLLAILEACWRAFDAAADSARGKTLRKGPRGGGRPLLKIISHVLEADAGYLGALGWRYKLESASPHGIDPTRAAVREGLAASVRGEIPPRGPRGGRRMKPRYFVRRSAWHVLDHAWEIEDRAI
jgi:hypothetical protein